MPELEDGACGGFAALDLDSPVPLLEGRISIARLSGMADSPRPTNIMAAPPTSTEETRLFLERDRARFVVFARELHATAGPDPLAAIREALGEDDAALELQAPLRAFVLIPRTLDTSEEAVRLLDLFTVTDDERVQRTTFFVSPVAAQDGGCRQVALRLARTVQPGRRAVESHAGERMLEPGLGITLPDGYTVTVEGAHDFSVYRIHPTLPLGAGASMGIYVGGHPSPPEAEGAREIAGTLLGTPITWLEREADGGVAREALVPHPSGQLYLHVFLRAAERSTLDVLVRVAGTLTTSPTRPSLAACATAEVPPAPPRGDDPDVARLARARSYSSLEATWTQPAVEEVSAYRRLLESPSAAAAFLHLALAADTTEGRLWGLTGLRIADPAAFDAVVCAVRDDLPATARALEACGERDVDVAQIIESTRDDAIRGEPFWGPLQWDMALGQGTADLRGGGLPRELLRRSSTATTLADNAARLMGDGYRPPLTPDASEPPPLVNGRRGASAAPYLGDFTGGGCAVRADGRVACWGGERPGDDEGAPEVELMPDVLRYPRDLLGRFGAGCMLDAEGTRVCWGGIEHSARLREQECGGPPAPDAPIVLQQHDDGPWERLLFGNQLCGVRPDGTLHCFVRGLSLELPAWATLDRDDMRFVVPIPGHVIGATNLYNGTVVWTREGGIHLFDRDEAPREVGRFEGVTWVATGVGATYFASLRDGRVMAYGVADHGEWWRHYGGPRVEAWREIGELRGARVFADAYHGCALFADGRVACFGNAEAFLPSADHFDTVPLTDVPALRGAVSLHLAQNRVCGLLPRDRVVCVGSEGASGMPGVAEGTQPAVLELGRLLQRAQPRR